MPIPRKNIARPKSAKSRKHSAPAYNPFEGLNEDLEKTNAQLEKAELTPLTPNDPTIVEKSRALAEKRNRFDARLANQEAERALWAQPNARDISAGLARIESRDFHKYMSPTKPSPYSEVQTAIQEQRKTPSALSQYKPAPSMFDKGKARPVVTQSGKKNYAAGRLQPKNRFSESALNVLPEVPTSEAAVRPDIQQLEADMLGLRNMFGQVQSSVARQAPALEKVASAPPKINRRPGANRYSELARAFDESKAKPTAMQPSKTPSAQGVVDLDALEKELGLSNPFASAQSTERAAPAIPPRPSAMESEEARRRYELRTSQAGPVTELEAPATTRAAPARPPNPSITALEEAKRRYDLRTRQAAHVAELEDLVNGLNTDFRQANTAITKQGQSVDNVLKHATDARDYVRLGNKHLAAAANHDESIRRKQLALLGLGGGALAATGLAATGLSVGLGAGIPASQQDDNASGDTSYPTNSFSYDPAAGAFSKKAKGGKVVQYAKGGRINGCAIRGLTKGKII